MPPPSKPQEKTTAPPAMKHKPKVTCFMPTYNRVTHPSVAESVEAFLRQDYPRAELIIFNDCAEQTIEFNHPKVQVVNVKDRSKSLSHACNRAVELGTGDLVTMWTDDDIRLPWTLSVLVEALVDEKGKEYEHVTVGPHFYSLKNKITSVVNSAVYQTGIFTRRIWNELGGYDPVLNQDHDMEMEGRVGKTGKSRGGLLLPASKSFLIYRWDDGHFHLSGQQPRFHGDPAQYDAQAKRTIVPGTFNLSPHWRRDYVADATQAVEKYRADMEAARARVAGS